MGFQFDVYMLTQNFNRHPLGIGVGLSHTGIFMDAPDVHAEVECRLANVGSARYRRRAGRDRGTRKRNMPLPRHESRSWIQANPARAGQINFSPGVQIGEIFAWAGGTIYGFDIRRKLYQITRHKTRGQP